MSFGPGERVTLRPVRQSLRMTGEMVVRIALAVFLFWVGSTDPDGEIVLALCGIAGIYHLWVAFQLLTLRDSGATCLELDRDGVTLQKLWKRRHVPWNRVTALEAQPHRLLTWRQAGVRVEIGDARGLIDTMVIPDVFEPGPRALVAEMEIWRQGRVPRPVPPRPVSPRPVSPQTR